ncbi:helix-turn-helix domain-containing protein [Enterococcus sp. AZ109]|uniref:helix-turn-helix domain-containing protein n=1 Tax=Enterococcus sp. AZ109 TaxID=2774634 RepID=UPI003F23450D
MLPNEISCLFLTKQQLQILTILLRLHPGELLLINIEKQLNISKRQVRRIVDNLNEEFLELDLTGMTIPALEICDGQLQFVPRLEDAEYVRLINCMKEKYMSISGLYQVLLFVLEKRSFTLIQLANALAYSESYAYKLLGKLKQFLTLLNNGIHLTKKGELTICLAGDESSVRMLHYLSVMVVLSGNTWLFKNIKEEEIEAVHTYLHSKRYKVLSPLNKKRANSIFAIYESALRSSCYLPQLPEAVLSLGRYMNKEKEIPLYLKYLKKENLGNNDQLHQELVHLAYVINYFTQELRTKKEKISLGQGLCSLKDHEIVKPCFQLVNEIRTEFQLSDENYYFLIYTLCNRLVVIHYLELYKYMLFDEPVKFTGEAELFIGDAMNKLFKRYRKEDSFTWLKNSFIQIIVGYLTLSANTTQKVYVEFLLKPEYKSVIENSLSLQYSEKVLKIVEEYNQADIVISDNYLTDSQKKYFFFRDVFDQNAWKNLGAYLNETIKNEVIKNVRLSKF